MYNTVLHFDSRTYTYIEMGLDIVPSRIIHKIYELNKRMYFFLLLLVLYVRILIKVTDN